MKRSAENSATDKSGWRWWMSITPRWRDLPENPVYILLRNRKRIRTDKFPWIEFITGFAISVSTLVTAYFIFGSSLGEHMWAGISVALIMMLVLGSIFYLRLFFICLIRVPVDLIKLLDDSSVTFVWVTPISSQDFFYGLVMPNLGIVFHELRRIFSFVAGLFSPIFLMVVIGVYIVDCARTDSTWGLTEFWSRTGEVLLISGFILIGLLYVGDSIMNFAILAYAGAAYSVNNNAYTAIFISFFYFLLMCYAGYFLAVVVTVALGAALSFIPDSGNVVGFAAPAISIVFIKYNMLVFTGRMGTNIIEKARRAVK